MKNELVDGRSRAASGCAWFAGLAAGRRAGIAAAAVLGKETKQGVHRVELRGIDDEPAFLARHDEVCVGQLFQMERQR